MFALTKTEIPKNELSKLGKDISEKFQLLEGNWNEQNFLTLSGHQTGKEEIKASKDFFTSLRTYIDELIELRKEKLLIVHKKIYPSYQNLFTSSKFETEYLGAILFVQNLPERFITHLKNAFELGRYDFFFSTLDLMRNEKRFSANKEKIEELYYAGTNALGVTLTLQEISDIEFIIKQGEKYLKDTL
jgi:hypothetical protein